MQRRWFGVSAAEAGARVRGCEGRCEKRLGRWGRRGPQQQPRAAQAGGRRRRQTRKTKGERRLMARRRRAETLGRWRPRPATASLRGTWRCHVTRLQHAEELHSLHWRPPERRAACGPPLRHEHRHGHAARLCFFIFFSYSYSFPPHLPIAQPAVPSPAPIPGRADHGGGRRGPVNSRAGLLRSGARQPSSALI